MLPLLRFLLSAFHLWEACATEHNDRCIRSTAKILIMLDLNHHFMPCDAIWSITQEKQGCQRQIFFKISSTNLPGFPALVYTPLHTTTHLQQCGLLVSLLQIFVNSSALGTLSKPESHRERPPGISVPSLPAEPLHQLSAPLVQPAFQGPCV